MGMVGFFSAGTGEGTRLPSYLSFVSFAVIRTPKEEGIFSGFQTKVHHCGEVKTA